jgi:Ca2+/Na+ antiporter
MFLCLFVFVVSYVFVFLSSLCLMFLCLFVFIASYVFVFVCLRCVLCFCVFVFVVSYTTKTNKHKHIRHNEDKQTQKHKTQQKQEVCTGWIYEPHRDKQIKQNDFTLKYKRYAKPYMSLTLHTFCTLMWSPLFVSVRLIYGFAYLLYFNVKSFVCPCEAHIRLYIPFTLKYKRYVKPYMSPTETNKGLHIKVQKVCKAVYEPHRDKQRTSH